MDLLPLVNLIRKASVDDLTNGSALESLLVRLGIGPEKKPHFILSCYPDWFMDQVGLNLKAYQNPTQFANYLIFLSDKKIRSYMEIGALYGGTFIITTEYLDRFNKLEKVVVIEPTIWENENLTEYQKHRSFEWRPFTSFSEQFAASIVDEYYDLCLIDADHNYYSVCSDFARMKDKCNMIVFHDIVDDHARGVVEFWNEIKGNYRFHEFTQQFHNHQGCHMGIGVLEKEDHRSCTDCRQI